jgi:hypothetical protein
MNTLKSALVVSTVFGLAAGCMAEETPADIDPQVLATYRTAIPSAAQVTATSPQASALAAAGDPALYPNASRDIVTGINGSVTGIVEVMRTIVDLPPTVYNSATSEFVWGPFPNDGGIGFMAAYIRDAGPDEDFRYHYALLRGIDKDVAKMVPVIWGGATPDATNGDHGAGITLWDFEANYAFEQANNPDVDSLSLNRGRFVTVYGKGYDENNTDNEFAFVVAVFRDFVPEDKPATAPVDLDYFYGRYITPENTVDFIDWQANLDVSEPADGVAETVGVRMAFLDKGMGRAEADAIDGSLAAGESASVVECWDNTISQTYVAIEVAGGANNATFTEGELTSCGLFQASLDELKIPSLETLDPAHLAALDQVATTGVPAE